jgi:hypothetical protein
VLLVAEREQEEEEEKTEVRAAHPGESHGGQVQEDDIEVPIPRSPLKPPPPAPSPTADLSRQRHLDPAPGAYYVSPGHSATLAAPDAPAEGPEATGPDARTAPPALPSLVEAEPVISSVLVEATPVYAEVVPEDATPLGADDPGPARRNRLLVLSMLAVGVAVAVVVGSVVGTTVRSGAPPTNAETSPSIWSSDASESKCSSQRDSLHGCVNHTGPDASACEQCIVGLWPSDPTSCSQIVNQTCAALNSSTCSSLFCSGCERDFLEYFQCKANCSLDDCAALPQAPESGSGSQIPASAPANQCTAEGQAWVQCMQDAGLDNDAMITCGDCHLGYLNSIAEGMLCRSLVDFICSKIRACSSRCGNCDKEILGYQRCDQGRCFSGTCPSPAPSTPSTSSPSPTMPMDPSSTRCSTERSAFYKCVTDNQGDFSSCLNCFQSRLPEGNITCAQYEPYLCSEVSACPTCGPCTAEDVAWTNCLQQDNCYPFTCPEITPPTAAPTPYVCPDESDAYWSCVADFTGGYSSECRACRNQHFNVTINTCQDSQIRTCGLDDACPMCGRCEDQQVSLVNCLNGAACEPFSCSSSASPSPSP